MSARIDHPVKISHVTASHLPFSSIFNIAHNNHVIPPPPYLPDDISVTQQTTNSPSAAARENPPASPMSTGSRWPSQTLSFAKLEVVQCAGRGVLSIKLLHFQNKRGRTYEGQCCDPTPLDSATCHDPCDYVMRLIVSGLGRANDHVFLFHRPLKYDSNDLHFERDGGDLTLTILLTAGLQR
ncbi:hypothetical protein C0Q70_20448 [Pomacea canaliculata]|uniref:Notch ligand N-terminal domain-containing protein n=1 Tax=Pomacea canaliculata TaxID=400727 RepID=A0A2T7NFK6_POMCA|nr:hypothetical protein C0Q70_20448 [Pomacea canaliculata]